MQEFQRNIPFRYRLVYGIFQFMDHFLSRKISFAITRPVRMRFYSKLHKRMKKGQKGKVIKIDRKPNLSAEDFRKEYLLKNRPVILEGLAKEWDCVKNWSLEFLKEQHGDDKIILVNQEDIENTHEELTLAELIDGINDGLARYYRFYPLIQRHPERLLDFDYKLMQKYRHKDKIFDAFQVFVGPDKSYTPLHNANAGNLFTQVHGTKEWVLYPEYYTAVIDPNPVRSNYRTAPIRKEYGPYNPFDPDYEHPYHLFKDIDSYHGTLNPGDILYNPPYWWHSVKSKAGKSGGNIGVGYRWLPLGFNFKKSPFYSFLDMCATRPFVWKTWKLSQIDPNLTHLAEVGKLKEYLKNKK
jgi:hypothetical protein